MKKIVSCIIVAYKNEKALKRCLASIPPEPTIETIVIDNTVHNLGFSQGCNLGAQKAEGEFLFFINPDTVLFPDTIQKLLTALTSDASIGIVAPQLVSLEKKPYLSFTRQPRWFSTPIVFSVFNKFFPSNPISQWHFYTSNSLEEPLFLEAVSGAACMISKKLYTQIQGFDPSFFMYWEDYDFCQKVLDAGKKILYFPTSKIIHQRGGSSQNIDETKKYFLQSRKIFFKKRFGPLYARVLEWWLQLPER